MSLWGSILKSSLRGPVGSHWREFTKDRGPLVWLLGLVAGIVAACATILFRWVIGWTQFLWLGTPEEKVVTAAAALPWWLILLGPPTAGLFVGLILTYGLRQERTEGVPEVIEASAIKGARISLRKGLWTALATAISLGGGASAGREGPAVHLGATLTSSLADPFRFPPATRRVLLACGVAGAVSASFNAPIAGILFAHEVILGHYALRAFVPITISSVAATLIARYEFGEFPAFIIPDYAIASFYEFPIFAVLGVVSAGVAVFFMATCFITDNAARRVPIPLWSRPVVGGVLVGLIGVFFPHVLGVGYEATDMALKESLPLLMLIALVFAKTIATAITLASRFGGGVFSPSLYLGAMAGGAFGIAVAAVLPGETSPHGLYAIVGMGAVAAAVLGAPISTTLIVFELTGDYQIALALLLAVSISTALTQAVVGASFFHWALEARGIFLRDGPHRRILRNVLVHDFMHEDPPAAAEGHDLGEDPPWLLGSDSLGKALGIMEARKCDYYPVHETPDSDQAIGWVTRQDALDVFNKELIGANLEAHR